MKKLKAPSGDRGFTGLGWVCSDGIRVGTVLHN
jgi:hypothetical protein